MVAICCRDQAQKGAGLLQNKAPLLGKRKVGPPELGFPQSLAIVLVVSQGFEGDQAECPIVGAFVRSKIADEVPTTCGDNVCPLVGVLLKEICFEGVDLVLNKTGNCHPSVSTEVNRLPT